MSKMLKNTQNKRLNNNLRGRSGVVNAKIPRLSRACFMTFTNVSFVKRLV